MSAQFSENGFGRPSNYHVNKKRCWAGFMGTSWCVYVYLFIYFDGPGLCLQKMGNPKRTVDGSAKTFHLGENDIVSSTSRERKGVSRGTCLNSVMSKPHIYVGVRPNSAKRWPSRDERALKFAAIIINASSRKKRAVKKSKRFFFFTHDGQDTQQDSVLSSARAQRRSSSSSIASPPCIIACGLKYITVTEAPWP